ncbi:MAG: hypothetical protein JW776_12525 [Candidatus Lokiarchaeota archaeon]|nr:hypothetical protein [Candidatus Lokiarchaeota archaeon]
MSIIQKKLKISVIALNIILIFFVLGVFNVTAQNYSRQFQINDFYEFTEYSDNIDNIHVNQTINIPIGSDRWTVTGIEMNFSEIKLEREIKIIEDGGNGWDEIKKGLYALGAEIEINEPTELFGVEIHGALQEGVPINPLYIQIQGYNLGPDTPNGTILAETPLNMSKSFTWYTQMFPSAIALSPGQYYLVFNGSGILPQDKSIHIWTYNDDDPLYPDLHTSHFDTSWSTGTIGSPYRYKLIQKVNRSYNPEDINMTAVINATKYTISNGSVAGTGVLNIPDLNLNLTNTTLEIPVENNISVEMEFELGYRINLINNFFSPAQIVIQQGTTIQWNMFPNLQRTSEHYNYSIEFRYPDSWTNLEILRNNQDISTEVNIDEINNIIKIYNETILSGSSWQISANSPNLQFGITIQQSTYEPGQLIGFSVNAPHQSGNLTFIFIDSSGFLFYNETRVTAIQNLFNYEISNNPIEGRYYALIYWNNHTDAGLVVQEYNIIIPFSFTKTELVLIVTGSISLPIVGVLTVQSIKSSRRKKEAVRQKIYNKYQDVLNLEHIIIADKRTGLDIYDESISGKGISASLITGFLQAIRSFGIELTNSDRESQTIKLEYQNSKIIMAEFKNLRTTLIMKDAPSQDFVDAVKNLSEEIEEKYHAHLENFMGKTTAFKNLNYFISKHLNTGLIYPLKLNLTRKTRLTPTQKTIVQRVKSIMKQNKTDYFYVSQLFSEKKGFQMEYGESILKLIDKGIFFQKK